MLLGYKNRGMAGCYSGSQTFTSLKVIRRLVEIKYLYHTMNRRTIHYAIVGCIVAMAAAVIYAAVRLLVLSQRADTSILVVNVVVFAGIAGVLIYLTKKEHDIQEEGMFRD